MREASGRRGDCATRIVAVCGPVDLEGEGHDCHPDVHAEEKALRSENGTELTPSRRRKRVKRSFCWISRWSQTDPARTSHLLPSHHLPTRFARSVLNTHAVSDDGKSLGS